jgi:hypothetical protein
MDTQVVSSTRRYRLSSPHACLLCVALIACRDVKADPDYCRDCPLVGDGQQSGAMTDPVSTTESGGRAGDSTPGSGGQASRVAGSPERSQAGQGDAASGSQSGSRAGVAGLPASGEAGTGSAGWSTDSSQSPKAGRSGAPDAGRSGASGRSETTGGAGGASSPCGPCSTDKSVCSEAKRTCVQCTQTANAACIGATPVCEDDVCVQCADDSHCPAATICDLGTHRCVGCLSSHPGSCSGGTPACDDSVHECVECLGGQTQACKTPRPYCVDDIRRCAECTTDTHCSTRERPRCEAHVCAGCRSNADCQRWGSQSSICDLSGACVQCELPSDCASNETCDTARHACMSKPPEQQPQPKHTCDPCTRDEECAAATPGAACIALGQGSHCFTAVMQGSECGQPYRARNAPGRSGTYCLPEDSSSCEALAAVGTSCTDRTQSSCGLGGVCSAAGRCTVQCSNKSECPSGYDCSASMCAMR